jgi:hypothetical protein
VCALQFSKVFGGSLGRNLFQIVRHFANRAQKVVFLVLQLGNLVVDQIVDALVIATNEMRATHTKDALVLVKAATTGYALKEFVQGHRFDQ